MIELIGAIALLSAVADPAEPAKDPVICKGDRSSRSIGSNMLNQRECRRKSEWDAIEKQTQRDMQQVHDRYVAPGRADRDRAGGN